MNQMQGTQLSQTSHTPESDGSLAPASAMLPNGRYPKRERAEVKYCEVDIGESESESEDDADECPPPTKRPKIVRTRRPLPKHKIFPFMELPAETRNQIYRECLVSDQRDEKGRPSFYLHHVRRGHRHTVTRGAWEDENTSAWHYHRHRGYNWNHCDVEAESEAAEVKTLGVSLLATCKAIYAETAPLLYHQRFVFRDGMALIGFMSECTPRAGGLIRNIEILQWLKTRSRKNIGFLAISLLAAKGCVNLNSLEVADALGWFHTYGGLGSERKNQAIHDRVARKVYSDFYPWLEAVGRASGNMYKGLSVLDIGVATWQRSSASAYLDGQEKEASLISAYHKALKKLIRENWL